MPEKGTESGKRYSNNSGSRVPLSLTGLHYRDRFDLRTFGKWVCYSRRSGAFGWGERIFYPEWKFPFLGLGRDCCFEQTTMRTELEWEQYA